MQYSAQNAVPRVLLNAMLIYSSLIDLACADRVAAALALGGVPLAEVVVVVLDRLETTKQDHSQKRIQNLNLNLN